MDDQQARDSRQDLTIGVYNEDNGRPYELHAGRGTPVSTVIERMYNQFGVTRQSDDRLRCDATGEDIFTYAGMHLGDYLDAGHCPDLQWVFAGGTGGA